MRDKQKGKWLTEDHLQPVLSLLILFSVNKIQTEAGIFNLGHRNKSMAQNKHHIEHLLSAISKPKGLWVSELTLT